MRSSLKSYWHYQCRSRVVSTPVCTRPIYSTPPCFQTECDFGGEAFWYFHNWQLQYLAFACKVLQLMVRHSYLNGCALHWFAMYSIVLALPCICMHSVQLENTQIFNIQCWMFGGLTHCILLLFWDISIGLHYIWISCYCSVFADNLQTIFSAFAVQPS